MTQTSTAEQATTSIPTTEQEWRERLTFLQYRVVREAATEGPFTGDYRSMKDADTYMCIGCGIQWGLHHAVPAAHRESHHPYRPVLHRIQRIRQGFHR